MMNQIALVEHPNTLNVLLNFHRCNNEAGKLGFEHYKRSVQWLGFNSKQGLP